MDDKTQLNDIRFWSRETLIQINGMPEKKLREALTRSLVNADKLLQIAESKPELSKHDKPKEIDLYPTSEERTILFVRCLLDEFEFRRDAALKTLNNLPEYDPEWDENTISNWLSAFDRLASEASTDERQIRRLKREIRRIQLTVNAIADETFGDVRND